MPKETRKINVYADTSVFGGVFDEEFQETSKNFFNAIREKRFFLLTSELVREEIQEAPGEVRRLFEEVLPISTVLDVTAEAIELQEAYLAEGIVAQQYLPDALHVALATTANASMIVSWNFKHIVNFQKIPHYNAVNTLKGYPSIAIYSPLEVIEYED
jgi:predicted nucleic acid-binding protein